MGRLNLEYFLAKRIASVSSGRRNNVMVRVATLSVAIGVAVMIVSLAVIFGFKREITAKLSGFGAHVQIASLDGNASSYETEPVSRDQPFADYLRGIPRFESLNPYAVKGGIPAWRRGDAGDQCSKGSIRPTIGRRCGGASSPAGCPT